MKVLIVNKFLYPNGGSETYVFKLGDYLKKQGHQVEYFGMEHSDRIVSNSANSYTSNMDFHTNKFKKLIYPFKIIYSIEARRKIRLVLDSFNPDVVHLNNFNFQLTSSIIHEIKKYENKINKNIKIVFTAHDYQLVCPNHMMNNPITKNNCEKCLNGNFNNCIKEKCIHGSIAKSTIGTIEANFNKIMKIYRHIDTIICPSKFIADKMNSNLLFSDKTIVMRNFIDKIEVKNIQKENYVLYFGRFSEEKGIKTLIDVCKSLPNIKFIFAGAGPLEQDVNKVKNIKNVGFKTGEELEDLIRKAKFTIYPSEWYENCPFSVMESLMYGTPVLAANIGGIPELIEEGINGELFTSKEKKDLKEKIELMWNDMERTHLYSKNCIENNFDTIDTYYLKLIKVYNS